MGKWFCDRLQMVPACLSRHYRIMAALWVSIYHGYSITIWIKDHWRKIQPRRSAVAEYITEKGHSLSLCYIAGSKRIVLQSG
ncbi:Nudc Domain-Containing Protein 2 [Manis pentadactyla]|nr:Nudc Domain-Containing Protein 2 [Manis pentadactyla]